MIILTEGVHNGTQGPLYYPKEELAKTPAAWNHKPIVVYHPSINGEGVSACDPTILSSRKVGVMLNTKWEKGRLKSEAWIEKDRANKVDDRIMTAVEAKEMMELSTGVFIDVEDTTGTWKGEDYTGIARNYRPDHLALLPDQIGACSIADGAGFIRNQASKDLMETLQKDPTLKALRLALVKMGVVENEMSFSNISQSLTTALREKFNVDPANGPWVWVQDVFSNFVIYEKDGKLYRLGYMSNDSGVTLSDETPVEVMRVTEYRTTTGTFVGNTNQQERPMEKKKQVDAIIAANVGWKETDRDVLMALSEDQLKLVHNVKSPGAATSPASAPAAGGGSPTIPAAGTPPSAAAKEKIDTLIAANVGLTEADRPRLNAFTEDQLGRIQLVKETPATSQQQDKTVTVQEFISKAPKGMQEVLNNSLTVYNEEKTKLIEVILANEQNGFAKQDLEGRSLGELKMLARLAAKKEDPTANRTVIYSGQAPVATTGNQAEEPLEIPVMNFSNK